MDVYALRELPYNLDYAPAHSLGASHQTGWTALAASESGNEMPPTSMFAEYHYGRV